MEFQKYSSLESAQKQKIINMAVESGHAKIYYGVTEKIHGANFGIHYDDDTGNVQFSRRTGFLEENETFYSHVKIERALRNRMNRLILDLKKTTDVVTVSVYGEIYGGSLNGVTEQGCKRVQKEVQYSPKTQFAAFDVIVNGKYLTMYHGTFVLGGAGFHLTPLIGIYNNLEDALAVPNDMQSRVPRLLGYEVEGDNVCEGTVIRPWGVDLYLPNGSHFILKNKNTKFLERGVAIIAKPLKPLSVHDNAMFLSLSTFVNENRLNAVISKEKELTSKDFGRIMGLLMQDALAEFAETYDSEDTVALDTLDEPKRVKKELQKLATVIVRNYWTTQL